jgi:hypothetical protein
MHGARPLSLLSRLRERPRAAICAMALLSSIAAGSFYVVLINSNLSARAYLGANPAWLMLMMAVPYLCAGLLALVMTFFSRMSNYIAVHAMMAVTVVSFGMLLLKLPFLSQWRGDMQGLGVLLDLAVQSVLVLLALPIAGVITWRMFRNQ